MAKASRDDLIQRRAFFEGLTGRSGASVGGDSPSVRSMLGTLYGTTRNGQSTIDTREAAKRLGVSQRTVQRWIKNDHSPSTPHLKDLQKRTRQAATTKRGRARSLRRAQQQQRAVPTQGVKVSVNGQQGPKDYLRERTTALDFTPEQHAGLMDAYEQGGDDGAKEYLKQVFSDGYYDNWDFGKVSGLRFSNTGARD